jgi:ABC-type cobalamin/Fe3+-siderophores transport system ATPase subunit
LISFTDYALVNAQGRPILEDINVTLPGSRITVIVGGNAAGKSLLMDAIAGRLQPGIRCISGTILIDQCGSAAVTEQARHELVDHLPQDAEVCRTLDAGWSERRSALLAQLVEHHKPVLLLDDPTCGFDSRRHAAWMQNLWQVSRSGRTVVLATSESARCLPWADWALVVDRRTVTAGPATEVCGQASNSPALPRSLTIIRPDHAAQLKNLVCSHLGLDTPNTVRLEQTCLTDYPMSAPMTLVSVMANPGATWLFPCDAQDLSPHLLSAEMSAYPKGHTYVPTA